MLTVGIHLENHNYTPFYFSGIIIGQHWWYLRPLHCCADLCNDVPHIGTQIQIPESHTPTKLDFEDFLMGW